MSKAQITLTVAPMVSTASPKTLLAFELPEVSLASRSGENHLVLSCSLCKEVNV